MGLLLERGGKGAGVGHVDVEVVDLVKAVYTVLLEHHHAKDGIMFTFNGSTLPRSVGGACYYKMGLLLERRHPYLVKAAHHHVALEGRQRQVRPCSIDHDTLRRLSSIAQGTLSCRVPWLPRPLVTVPPGYHVAPPHMGTNGALPMYSTCQPVPASHYITSHHSTSQHITERSRLRCFPVGLVCVCVRVCVCVCVWVGVCVRARACVCVRGVWYD